MFSQNLHARSVTQANLDGFNEKIIVQVERRSSLSAENSTGIELIIAVKGLHNVNASFSYWSLVVKSLTNLIAPEAET